MKEMHEKFNNTIIQFEDFHTTLAFSLLRTHRDAYPCFNDDSQFPPALHTTSHHC